jgi:uncharacterized membrane protein YfhO
LLGARYLVFRGTPKPGWSPVFQSPDYWIMENSNALPRVFVPERVEFAPDKKHRLDLMRASGFEPRQVALTETPLDLPTRFRGKAEITESLPARVAVQATMETRGLLVLADRWDPGWKAYVNGQEKPIAVVDHALRGVVLPAGRSTVEFRYESASLALGLRLSYTAAGVIVLWVLGVLLRQRMSTHAKQRDHLIG